MRVTLIAFEKRSCVGGPMKMHWFGLLCSVVFGACGGQAEPPLAPPPPALEVAPPPAPEPIATTPPPPPAPPEPKLKLQIFTSSPEGFLVTSTLVSGATDAVLIDAQFTLGDAKKLAEMVKASNKKLTTVYVTHAHPDHYFGFAALKEVFPEAKLVALPATIAEIQKTWQGKVKQWKPVYKDAITAKPVVPEPLLANAIELDGEKLEIVGGVQGDDPQSSYVWIPSLGALVAGDIVFDQVFPWTAESTPETRKAWAAVLDSMAAHNPKLVVPGHQKPERVQDTSNLKFTKEYLAAFDEAVASSKNAAEVIAKLKAKYPDAGLDIVLKIGAEAAFKKVPKAPAAGAKATPAPSSPTAAVSPKAAAPAAPGTAAPAAPKQKQ
jgi:glyoxylase-like metal-dependent hydrolase (beta-lactamase superfamily II)